MLSIIKKIPFYRALVIAKDWIKISLFLKGDRLDIRREFDLITVSGYRNLFFGYYDYSPFNPENSNLVVFHGNNLNIGNPPTGSVDIILYDLVTKKFEIVGSTTAWNWQQGSRLCWLDSNRICYNTFNETKEEYEANIYNIKSRENLHTILPFQAKLSNAHLLAINYKILADTRPDYGYFCHRKEKLDFSNAGIHTFSIEGNHAEKIIGVEQIKPFLSISLKETKYWFNHLLIAPDERHMIFLFRVAKDGKTLHHLFLYNFEKERLDLLLENVVSHYCWKNSDEIVYWGRQPEPGYYVFNITEKSNKSIVNGQVDGHPSVIGDNILTDTYPMRDRRRKLYLHSTKTHKEEILGYFFENPKYRYDNRCDLHPSVSSDQKFVQVDSNFDGNRNFLILSL